MEEKEAILRELLKLYRLSVHWGPTVLVPGYDDKPQVTLANKAGYLTEKLKTDYNMSMDEIITEVENLHYTIPK